MENHGGNIYRVEKNNNIKKEEILDYSSNINPLGVPDKLINAIKDNIDVIINYPDPDYEELKNALAGYTNVNNEDIIVGNGAAEIIFLYARMTKPESALIVAPTFVEYQRALHEVDAKIDHYRLKEEEDFIPDISGIKQELKKNMNLLLSVIPIILQAHF